MLRFLSLVLFININFEFSSPPKPKNIPNPTDLCGGPGYLLVSYSHAWRRYLHKRSSSACKFLRQLT